LSWAASFDCAKARTADEKAICANCALNDKDVKMSVLYDINKRTLAMGGRGALRTSSSSGCRAASQPRLRRLTGRAGRHDLSGPF
jgi:uncharacterized protein